MVSVAVNLFLSPLFATVCHCLPLFATVCHCLPLFATVAPGLSHLGHNFVKHEGRVFKMYVMLSRYCLNSPKRCVYFTETV